MSVREHPIVVVILLAAVGGLIAGLVLSPGEVWSGVLIAGLTGFYVAVGAGLFAAISVVSGARWWRGLEPLVRATLLVVGVPAVLLALVFAFGLADVYPWAVPGAAESSHLLHEKASWLNRPFFLGRAMLLLIVFIVLSRLLIDAKGKTSVRTALAFIIIGGVCLCVASWDWAMSIEPEWFSTMYGVYGFSSAILGGIAAVTVLGSRVARWGWSPIQLTDDQRHSLGKFLFGFSFFWAYIWFCQFMLIWYANMPEETGHYIQRMHGGWSVLFWLNPVLSFVIPFFVLLSSRVKRHSEWLFQIACFILVGRWFDVMLMVLPGNHEHPTLPWAALSATAILLLGAVVVIRRALRPTLGHIS